MKNEKEKTHWLQNQNKNYLGHFDLPNGDDVILTIAKADWEIVKNPKTKDKQNKRVIRFVEKHDWVKPFICNETNAKMIFKMTEKKYMEDCAGDKIKIGLDKTKIMGDEVDCLRVRQVKSSSLTGSNIIVEQELRIKNLCVKKGIDIASICNAYKINAIDNLPASKFAKVIETLNAKPDAIKEEVVNANN